MPRCTNYEEAREHQVESGQRCAVDGIPTVRGRVGRPCLNQAEIGKIYCTQHCRLVESTNGRLTDTTAPRVPRHPCAYPPCGNSVFVGNTYCRQCREHIASEGMPRDCNPSTPVPPEAFMQPGKGTHPNHRRPPPAPERLGRERTERLKSRAKAYLALKNFPQLDGDPLSTEALFEAVLHYAEQDLPPVVDPEKERQARELHDKLSGQTHFYGVDRKEDIGGLNPFFSDKKED